MKKLLTVLLLAGSLVVSARGHKPIATPRMAMATCTGATPCKACKNCKYCKHCARDGKTCGVCKK